MNVRIKTTHPPIGAHPDGTLPKKNQQTPKIIKSANKIRKTMRKNDKGSATHSNISFSLKTG